MEINSKMYSGDINEEKLSTRTLTWTCPFKGSIKDLNESENWYKFLNIIYCKFSEYAMQVSIRNYTDLGVKDIGNRRVLIEDKVKKECTIEDYIADKAGKVIEIDDDSVKRFLNKTIECNIANYDSIENFTITSVRLKELNRVLNLTLNYEVHVTCEGQNIFVKGDYITTGDILLTFLLLERDGKNENCKNVLASKESKIFNIFALNTFFIDFDIDWFLTQKHNIVKTNVIAPKWKIIDRHKIELRGKDGELPEVGNEKDGKRGNPGGPGGNFFGIGSDFLNGKNLKISVNGGDGSSGQDGKNGENGTDGAAPATPSDIFCGDLLCDENKKINGFNCQKIRCVYDSYSRYNNKFQLTRWCHYEMFGKPGTEGSDGGNGGIGGKGGYPGNIVLFELNSDSLISLAKNSGQNGACGKGGIGGVGGKRGNNIIVECWPKFFTNLWSLVNKISVNERSDSGRNGTDGTGFSDKGMREAAAINNLDLAKIINQYKSYLRENLQNHFTSYSLNLFLIQLENNHDIKNVYDTLGFIHELKSLEEQFHLLNADIDFRPFYESLLNRIGEYAKTIKYEYSSQHKKVLAYLYTVVLGRIHNMDDNLESNLIININEYLKNVKEDIKKLKNINNAKYKEELINKYKEEYKHEIDIKINEAKELISTEITPEIGNIENDIDTQIETLINEVMYLQEQNKIEHENLIEKQQQLQTTFGLQGLFSVFKIVGQVISFLGPVGAIAGTVIGTGSTIAESFLSDNDDRYYSITDLPQSVAELESISRGINSISERRVTCLKNTLDSISLEILKHPDILSNISMEIVSLKDKLDKMHINEYNFLEILALEKELEVTVQIQEADSSRKQRKNFVRKNKQRDVRNKYKGRDQVRSNKNKRVRKRYRTKDPKVEEKKLVMRKLQRIVQMGIVISDTINKYKNNRAKLDTIAEALKHNNENFAMLKHYEQEIYKTIMPMLQNIQKDLDGVISKLGTKSKVALDVTKWQVKSTLRDMLLRMKQLTSGLKPQANLARCIEKLEEAMVTIIDVNSHIQDYQKDQNYASFIAKISSVSETDISIANDPKLQEDLRKAIRELEITVRSNIVVQRHKVAINALKQIVFPFAHTYFKDLVLPAYLELTDNKNSTTLENLVYRAETEIEKINMKLEEYKTTVKKSDGCNGKGVFISDHISSKPFFVWKKEKDKKIISRVLSGEAVIVKADIKNSSPKKDAIKFNVAEFHFKSENETLQSQLDNKLKGFQLSATHLGNSYYRYENKFYKIMTASQEIWYYFERKLNGDPFDNSDSYDKIRYGNVTLSPYASWKIKLDIVGDNSSFKDLEIHKDTVDIVLEGRGHYFNKLSMSCKNVIVDSYYQPINTVYEADINVK